MEKEKLLEEISQGLREGVVSREELLGFLGFDGSSLQAMGIEDKKEEKRKRSLSVTEILYYLGGVVIVLGIVFFFAQIWAEMDSFFRIVVTLGLGMIFAFFGTVFLKTRPDVGLNLGTIFHFVGGVLIPSGMLVVLSEFNWIDRDWSVTFALGVAAFFYLLLDAKLKHPILTFFTLVLGTLASYGLIGETVRVLDVGYETENTIFEYFAVAVGVFYLFTSFKFREGRNKSLLSFINFFGSAMALVALFLLAMDYGFWLLIFPFLALGSMFLSTVLKSRGILINSTLALLSFMSYVTGKYFADSIGWPISLIFLGFVFIGLGFVSISVNKKYLKSE